MDQVCKGPEAGGSRERGSVHGAGGGVGAPGGCAGSGPEAWAARVGSCWADPAYGMYTQVPDFAEASPALDTV